MRYVSYRNNYLPHVLKLLHAVFPEKHITSTSFHWKHFDEYFQKKTVGILAVDDVSVRSVVYFVPAIAECGGKRQVWYSCALQATHMSFRRMGLVSTLTRMAEQELDHAQFFGFSNESGVLIDRHSHTIPYRIVGRLRTYYLPTVVPHKSAIHIDRCTNITGLPSVSEHGYAHIVHDAAYLMWRYARHPKHVYEYFSCGSSGKKIGYVIAKVSRYKYEISTICLFDRTALKDVLTAFGNFARSQYKPVVSVTFLPNEFVNSCVGSCTLSRPASVYFTVKTTNTTLFDANAWFIQGGDIQ